MFKSYGFWTALAGALVVLANALGKCFGFEIEDEIITDVVMAIAGVLVVFGVVSMPKKKEDANTETDTIDNNDEIENNGEIEGVDEIENVDNFEDDNVENEKDYAIEEKVELAVETTESDNSNLIDVEEQNKK